MRSRSASELSWYVYTLHDPREPTCVRYVGWTRDHQKRLQGHIRNAANGRDRTYCGNWKRSLLAAGVRPVLVIVESGVGDGWNEAEIWWIQHLRSQPSSHLTNLARGGGGSSGCHWRLSAETRAKIGAASKGRIVSTETRAKIRAQKLGRTLSAETRAKMSAAHLGKKRSLESVEKSAAAHLGKSPSEDTREKLRAQHAKLREAPVEAPKRSVTSRAKTSASLRKYYAEHGTRSLSDETRKKISLAVKAYRSGHT